MRKVFIEEYNQKPLKKKAVYLEKCNQRLSFLKNKRIIIFFLLKLPKIRKYLKMDLIALTSECLKYLK